MTRRCLATALALLLLLGVAAPASAGALEAALASERPRLVPATLGLEYSPEQLQKQLAHYRDAMAGLDIDPEYLHDELEAVSFAQADYFTLSPDGKKAYLVQQGIPMLYDFDSRQLIFLIAKQEDAVLQRMPRQPDDMGIAWSPDGQWLALTSPNTFLRMLLAQTNILLVDVSTGQVTTLVPTLSADAKYFDEDFPGVPLAGAFSPDSSAYYYEMVYVPKGDEKVSQLWAHDLAGGDERLIGEGGVTQISGDANRYVVDGDYVSYVSDVKMSGQAGLQFLPTQGGEAHGIYLGGDARGARGLLTVALLGIRGNHALLGAHTLYAGPTSPMTLSLRPLAQGGEEALGKLLLVEEDEDGEARLAQVPMAKEMDRNLLYANNGALSPDGSHLLLRAGNLPEQVGLFLVDITTGEARRVDLSALDQDLVPRLASHMAGDFRMGRGLQWLDDGRLLMYTEAGKQLFTLEAGE